jgi:DNA polymerase
MASKLKWTPDGPQSTFTGPSEPAVVLHWFRQRFAIERGEEVTDPVVKLGRWCSTRRQNDRQTIWPHEHWFGPHRDDPDVWFLALLYRCCINDGRVAAEISLPLPFDAERYLAEMRARKAEGKPTEHFGHHAYTIYAYRGFDFKPEGHVEGLLKPAWEAREHFRPRADDTCATWFERPRELPGVGSFTAGQITADMKFFPPLCDAPDVMTFAVSGPGSRRGLARVLGKPLGYYENNEAQWRRDLDKFYAQIAPELERIAGEPISASDAQSALCETSKLERYRVDHGELQLYVPYGEAQPKKTRAPHPVEAPAPAPVPPVTHAIPELAAQRDPNAPHVLFRDIETRSACDLKACGAHRYAADPSTEVMCVAYAVDNEPIQLWVPGDPIPSEFIETATNPTWTVVAHNDAFESAIEEHILAPRFGWPLVPIERHRCTMAAANAAALPGSLDKAAGALGLDYQKDAAGHRVMMLMAKPKPGGGWFDDEARRQQLYAYCKADVEVERALFQKLTPLSAEEQTVWELDRVVNDRGFHTDGGLISAAVHIAETAAHEIEADLCRLTDGAVTSIGQTDRMIDWLAAHDCVVTDVQKSTLKKALTRKAPMPEARRLIELRLAGAHAAGAKPERLLEWRGADGRVRGAFRYHGASTGRWTSLGVQAQNFKKQDGDIGAAVAAVATGDIEQVRQVSGEPLALVGDIARAMICAAPGHKLYIADYNGVESRVLALVSGQQSKLDQWAKFDCTGAPEDEPYFALGRRFGLPPERARAIGKTADLAFGYMGSIGAWRRLADDDETSDEQIKRYQKAWRDAHPKTYRFWYGLDDAAIEAVQKPGTIVVCGRVAFKCDGAFLVMRLPSGRKLSYASPVLKPNDRGGEVVSFMSYDGGRWSECRHGYGAYGGTWTENAVQAVARDLLASAMQRLEAAGYPVVLHVHDEIVAEVPEDFGSEEEFRRLMTELPAWAEGLSIAAKVRSGQRFAKTEAPDERNDMEPIPEIVAPTLVPELAAVFAPRGMMLVNATVVKAIDPPALARLKRDDKWVARGPTKLPVNPHPGGNAMINVPGTWASYDKAAARARQDGLPGVSYAVIADDGLTGVDLDRVRDPTTGALEPWAAAIVAFAETYTEVSPSGAGLRMFWKGKIDKSIICSPLSVEVYRDGHFLSVTGQHLAGTPTDILPAPKTEAALRARVNGAKPNGGAGPKEAPPGPRSKWQMLNDSALADLDAWVPALFGDKAEKSSLGYRVSSAALGRELEEDLSITSVGIKDFRCPRHGRRARRQALAHRLRDGAWRQDIRRSRRLAGRAARANHDRGGRGGTEGRGAATAQRPRLAIRNAGDRMALGVSPRQGSVERARGPAGQGQGPHVVPHRRVCHDRRQMAGRRRLGAHGERHHLHRRRRHISHRRTAPSGRGCRPGTRRDHANDAQPRRHRAHVQSRDRSTCA